MDHNFLLRLSEKKSKKKIPVDGSEADLEILKTSNFPNKKLAI